MVSTQDRAAATGPSRRRFGGLLPDRLLRPRRPVLWQELALVALGYWLYSLGRNAIPGQVHLALRHARDVAELQATLHLNWELAVNRYVAAHAWLAQVCDYYYAVLHFVVTPVVFGWLFLRRPSVFRAARTVIFATTLLALLGFYLYPTAPPRLLPHAGYIDTVTVFHTWGSLANPDVARESNQYAAMPSLHIAWAVWCAVCVWHCARRAWVRLLAAAYPVATFLVIIGTANHFVLDAVAGAFVVALGFSVQWVLSGRGVFDPPVVVRSRRNMTAGSARQPAPQPDPPQP